MRDLSLHILDIVQNSLSAKSSIVKISVAADTKSDMLTITIADNGSGMSEEMIKKVTSPFVTSRRTRDVGLGIPLFAQSCESADGSLTITSQLGEGTQITATLALSHIDRPPLGDIAQTMAMLTVTNPNADFVLNAISDEKAFAYDTRQIKETLGPVPVTRPQVSAFIQQYLQEGLKQVFGGTEL